MYAYTIAAALSRHECRIRTARQNELLEHNTDLVYILNSFFRHGSFFCNQNSSSL